jgi:malate dehydrogenase (oxaloacetate-decarboxylating)
MRLEYPHRPGWIARIASVIAEAEGAIQAIDLVHIHRGRSLRDYTVECSSTGHARRIVQAIKEIEDVNVHSVSDNTFLMHLGGKLEIRSKVPLETRSDLSMAYTPGVARVCEAIHEDPRSSFSLTIRKNCIAVVSDGSAVLGLGNIGAAAAMPVMEGKAVLFKEFGGVDAIPLCIDTQRTDEIIAFCRAIAPTFGGINLEDIAAPRCFHVENELRESLEIPVFHDDQHGTAVVHGEATRGDEARRGGRRRCRLRLYPIAGGVRHHPGHRLRPQGCDPQGTRRPGRQPRQGLDGRKDESRR